MRRWPNGICKLVYLTLKTCVPFSHYRPNSFDVIVGEHNQKVNEGTEKTFPVQRVISYPNYQKPVGLNNDIALLRLAQRVQLSSRVNSVCLPSDSTNVATGSTCYITGKNQLELRDYWVTISSHYKRIIHSFIHSFIHSMRSFVQEKKTHQGGVKWD